MQVHGHFQEKVTIHPNTPLTVNHLPMGKVQSYGYLGLWFASSLSWSMQVKSVCQKARRQIGIIYRKFYGHSNCSTLLQGQALFHLSSKFILNSSFGYNGTHSTSKLHLKQPQSQHYHTSFEFQGAMAYNRLPETIRSSSIE